ncbi:hypothetical protein GY45DRAFT_1324748 [Cubamyces sp. BRFM 1775]|nr:hypothetical protein GY45DRAFT_1324748 [Cubamyces sp. BRFM 1775]
MPPAHLAYVTEIHRVSKLCRLGRVILAGVTFAAVVVAGLSLYNMMVPPRSKPRAPRPIRKKVGEAERDRFDRREQTRTASSTLDGSRVQPRFTEDVRNRKDGLHGDVRSPTGR